MANLNIENLTKTFKGGITAVADLSLNVGDGEFLVLVGPSGCGKTTTLRMIAGLEPLTAGRIRIADAVVNDLEPQQRDVAMVFQGYPLYPHMSVFGNLAFPLQMRRESAAVIDARVRAVASRLSIDGLLDRKPATLSGGQCQRVALGRAMIRRAEVYLFDEPLSSIDPSLRALARAELKSLRGDFGGACMYVTHDQAEAMALADRICVLRRGRVQQIGTPSEIYDEPSNRFVAGFFGVPAMNFFRGQLVFRQGTLAFVNEEIRLGLSYSPDEIDRACEGIDVVMGVRPEYMSIVTAVKPVEGTVQGRVRLVEYLGPQTVIYLEGSRGTRFTVQVPGRSRLRNGDRTAVSIAPQCVHLFEPGECGRNIVPASKRD